MKKILVITGIVLATLFAQKTNAQELKPHYVKRAKEIVKERKEQMDLDKSQVKLLKAKQQAYFVNLQKLRSEHKPGSEEFKSKLKEAQKDYNKFIVEFSTLEQRKKWIAYIKSKK